ncbi:MAG TPA: Gfo/Idh/MocA family oxidoreductase [archaeon]|nr:Gfo/Idh/MocA family oxidoreductase [archaeon]
MNFVIMGLGYVAPKHLKAIKDVGGNLIAALDPYDSVGVLDSYFHDCKYFREFERFDRFCSRNHVDYVSICSPNYLHDAHCRFALRIGANAICEKPLVLNERYLDDLIRLEEEYGKKVSCILQLRLNEELIQLRDVIQGGLVIVDHPELTYFTPRGNWYEYSWKADMWKSGGLVTNIGIHLFDLLQWLFGQHEEVIVDEYSNEEVGGAIKFKDVVAYFNLSINKNNKPTRLLKIDNYECSFSRGFTDLHTKSYQEILAGNGFGIEDVRPSIRLCEELRNEHL